ncbi:hypothetical protein EYC80_001764 [Monilinia laxa]|uniref:Uncharacterized protein n=1 Tax=Monilinia laxa TaxID=61186 RepID=A0A5N6K5Y1_MONLA|nr:hypothetical protein EYC80_001764 [Monilinia laxa]
MGGVLYGKFQGDADIAGVGIWYAYLVISCIALVASIIYFLQSMKFGIPIGEHGVRYRPLDNKKTFKEIPRRTIAINTFEAILLSCSDQQIFTSGAYTWVLLFSKQACKTSAYHFNIIGNMLLITCATHLLSITFVSQYWKRKLLAIIRILLISALYMATGYIMINQNVQGKNAWPTEVPPANETDNVLLLPAACFKSKTHFDTMLKNTFGSGVDRFEKVMISSNPGNHVHGWNLYVLMALFYGGCIIAEIFRCIYRYNHDTTIHKDVKWKGWRRIFSGIFLLYQLAGIVISTCSIIYCYLYIRDMREWMNGSGWIEPNASGANPERDYLTYGQMIPILLTFMTFFACLQLWSDQYSERRQRNEDIHFNDLESSNTTPQISQGSFSAKKDHITNITAVP